MPEDNSLQRTYKLLHTASKKEGKKEEREGLK